MTCGGSACLIEAVTQDPGFSPGPVLDHEHLSRGLYSPRHGKPENIKNGHLSKKELANRKISVWRTSDIAGFSVEDLKAQLLRSDEFGTLFAIAQVQTRNIRSYRVVDLEQRALCVRDECDIDWQGNKHPAHAHIALCNCSFPDPVAQDGEVFLQVWRDLCQSFKNNQVWPARNKVSAEGS